MSRVSVSIKMDDQSYLEAETAELDREDAEGFVQELVTVLGLLAVGDSTEVIRDDNPADAIAVIRAERGGF